MWAFPCSFPGYVRTKAMDGERNRPKELKNRPGEGMDPKDPGVQTMMKLYREGVNSGIQPEKVADIVFSAIRENRFYIHAGNEPAKPAIQARMEDILLGRNPTSVPADSK